MNHTVSGSGLAPGLIIYLSPRSSFNRIDMKTGKIVTPQPNKNYALEPITAEVINFGTDTVKGFKLAYSVNSQGTVTQFFQNKIRPGDTVVVCLFNTGQYGRKWYIYFLKVFGFGNNDEYIKNDTAQSGY